jgi:hypothetical protein
MPIGVGMLLVSFVGVALIRNDVVAMRMLGAGRQRFTARIPVRRRAAVRADGLLVTVSGVGKDTFDVFRALATAHRRARHRHRVRQRGVRLDHRHLDRLGHRVQPRRRPGDDPARLHQEIRHRRRRRLVGSRHADPAVAPDDRLRGSGGGVGRPHVPCRHRAGNPAGARLRGDHRAACAHTPRISFSSAARTTDYEDLGAGRR